MEEVNYTYLDEKHRFIHTIGKKDRYPTDNLLLQDYEEDYNLVGIIEEHMKPDGKWCGGGITFVQPTNPSEHEISHPTWSVESVNPLTISPSLLCSPTKGGCGNHGFIKQGKWLDL